MAYITLRTYYWLKDGVHAVDLAVPVKYLPLVNREADELENVGYTSPTPPQLWLQLPGVVVESR